MAKTPYALILALKPDLVFLDIQMPGMCGIEVLRALPQGSIPCIIFLTAYDEYALAAFEVQALDYLLKPIDNVRFLIALERARRILALQQQDALHSRFQKLLELHSERSEAGPAKRFAIRNGNQVTFVQSSEIDWIEAVGDYAGLHVGKKCTCCASRFTCWNAGWIAASSCAFIGRPSSSSTGLRALSLSRTAIVA